LAGHLRRAPELAHTRLVAVSGYGLEDDRRRAHAAGFHSHLTKPVEPSTLNALLASMAQG
jgi:CheY-like chemotaxis protein